MEGNKIIIGFVGQIASGKGTACQYLKNKYGASIYRFSTMLRDLCSRLYLDHSRDNLQTMSTAIRSHFGESRLSSVLAEDVKNDTNSIICIDGIRRPDDIERLQQIPGFILVHIFADMEKRYERIVKRKENIDDLNKTYDEFKRDHEKEAELKIAEIAKKAIMQIDNNHSIEELQKKLDTIVKKYETKN